MTARLSPRAFRESTVVDEQTKREAIVEAALRLFTTQGYETTTMAEVARVAGVGVGTVYLYFKNKNDLLYAVKGDWETQYLQYMALPEIQSIPHHLRARPLVEKSFTICEAHSEMVQLMSMQPEMIGDWYAGDHGLVPQAIEVMFREGMEAGVYRRLDCKTAAIVAYGMVNQALIQCFVYEGGANKEQYIETLVDALEHWLLTTEMLEKRDS